MRFFRPSRYGQRLAGFLVLSLGAHAVAFSLFRDPGEFLPIPPHGSGKVTLSQEGDAEMGLSSLFDPSAIVMPKDTPQQMAGTVSLPWQGEAWPAQPLSPVASYRPTQFGADAPLAVRAATSLGTFRHPAGGMIRAPSGKPVLESWAEISGDLRDRKPSKSLALPPLKSANALEPTAARIGVDEDGAVRFVFLEGSTGDAAADRDAANLLRTWRFAPSTNQWVEWGRVRVLWAVEPPAEGAKP